MKRDHPRVCGEKMHPKTSDSLISGSPPRMRGKAIDRHFPEPCFGITPAYAGKRGRNKSGQPAAKDHPRVCGEKADTAAACALCWGSPPRMRGKDPQSVKVVEQIGITPAYAGKRARRGSWCRGARDHPRVCGEKGSLSSHWCARWGSPPRMRGKAAHLRQAAPDLGITPAYAGKSGHFAAGLCPFEDHPRVCGEKTKKIP